MQDDPQQLWDTHREDFLKIYSKESQKPLTHSGLEKVFVDINGKQLYKFPTDMHLPVERFGQKKKLLQALNKGLTDAEDEEMDNAIAEIVLNGTNLLEIKKRVSGVLGEKQTRRKLVIHADIFYQLVAVELVREDENPEVYDNELQMDKVKTFKKMTRDGSTYFFFQQTGLKSLSAYLNFTQSEWDYFWTSSVVKIKSLPKVLEVFTSGITSLNQKKTSTAS